MAHEAMSARRIKDGIIGVDVQHPSYARKQNYLACRYLIVTR